METLPRLSLLISGGKNLHVQVVKKRPPKQTLQLMAEQGLLTSDVLISTSVDDGIGKSWMPEELEDIRGEINKANISSLG